MFHYKLKVSLLSIAAITFLSGCGGNKLDVLSYPSNIRSKVTVPEVCMPEYKSAMPTVAVIDFTNNSTFGKANISETNSTTKVHRKSSGVAGIVASRNIIGIGGVSTSNTKSKTRGSTVQRKVDAKLSESITGPLETIVLNSGGAKLFTRSDMDKIDAELKFQDSGLIDPKSAVKFGKTSGVRFLLTGSIDNVEQNYRGNTKAALAINDTTSKLEKEAAKLIGAFLTLGATVTDGMLITTSLTVKLLDVETGKIVFSKQLEEQVNIGKIRKPNYDQIVGGIKSAMLKSLPSLEKDLSIYFAVKGYITKLKTKNNEVIAQVNLGRDFKVEEDQIFKVYAFEENEDPMNGTISCDVIESTTTLRASQQITAKSTWTTVQGGNPSILKLGQLVQKTHKKAGFDILTF